MEVLNITEFVVLGAVIVGIVELVNRLRAKDYWAVVTIASAVAVGALFGALNYYPNLDAAEGVAVGFSAVGALKGLSVFGNKTSAQPNRTNIVAKSK